MYKLFLKEDIKNSVEEILKEDFNLEIEAQFGPNDFTNSSSEESFYLITCKKSSCSSLIQFWIKAFEKITKIEKRFEGESDYFEWFEREAVKVDELQFQKEFKRMTARLEKDVNLTSKSVNFFQLSAE